MHKKTILLILLLVVLVGGFALSRGTLKLGITPTPLMVAQKEVLLASGDTYNLTAASVTHEIGGKKYHMLAYNGSIPGPTIRVHQGDTITIHFTNNTDKTTLLHSHGVRMENAFDGSSLVQQEMKPGESFDYKLTFPDSGVYWYHPHVREDMQQPMGLYGNFIVTPNDSTYWPEVSHEETIFLSDLLIEDGAIAPYSDKYITHALMGRFGNTMLINGKTSETIAAEPGEVFRFYVTNAATVRPFNFVIGGGAKMKLVGGDNGRFEKETFVDSIIIGPAERVILDVYFPKAGSYILEHRTPTKTYPLGEVKVSGVPVSAPNMSFATLRTDDVLTKEFALLKKELARVPDKHLTLTMTTDMAKIMSYSGGSMTGMSNGMHGHDATGNDIPMTGMSGSMASSSMQAMMGMMASGTPPKIEWEDQMGIMNTYSTSDTVKWILKDEDTGKQNMDILWNFKQGSLVKIRITNDTHVVHAMQHPIHFHGNRFVVLATNGVPNDNMSWDDTVLLETGDTIDILLDTSNVGKWLAHCHIAEHMHSGMMLEYDVQ